MPWNTVAGNVELPFRIAGRVRSAERDRVAAALHAVGLAGFERSYPHQLSGGMRMRVSIARALVTGPDLLLLDEPFAALDEITRLALNDDLLRLWETHRPTILFVTHSVFESVYLSTRIAVMTARPGRIAADLPVPLPQPRQRSDTGRPGLRRDVRTRYRRRFPRRWHRRGGGCRPGSASAAAMQRSLRILAPLVGGRCLFLAPGNRRPAPRHPALHPAGPERRSRTACGLTGRASSARCW